MPLRYGCDAMNRAGALQNSFLSSRALLDLVKLLAMKCGWSAEAKRQEVVRGSRTAASIRGYGGVSDLTALDPFEPAQR